MHANTVDWTKLAEAGGFLLVAVWGVWGAFFKREVFYPFSKKQMGIRKGQIVSAFIALWFLFFAWLRLIT